MMNTRCFSIASGLCLLLALVPAVQVYGDGTEILGAIAIEQGSHIVAAGTGLFTQPGTINISVPAGADIKQVLLYWEGVTGADFATGADGAGVLVIYDDGSRDVTMEARDGQDLAFINFAPTLDTTVPQTFTFAPSDSARTAELAMFFGSVSNETQPPFFTPRPNLIEITVDGGLTTLVNALASNDGLEWDTVSTTVPIPAGATSLTVQVLSASDGTNNWPASLSWINVSLTLPVDVPCTGAIGDFVWDDLNGDGIQNVGEPGIVAVAVMLFDDQGLVATTVTDGAGMYLFTDLCPGTYVVEVDESTLPPDYVPTIPLAGPPDVDSDDSPVEVTLTDDVSVDLTIDFGYIPSEECADCEGKITELTLLYLGDVVDANIVVAMKKNGVIFDGIVQPGEMFAFIGADKNGTMGTEITVTVNGGSATKIHTSCSQPIGIGSVFGNFEVVAGASKDGGLFCLVDDVEGEPEDCGPCQGKVTELSFLYLGDVVDANIVVAMKKNGVIFDGIVQPGESFEVVGSDKEGTMGTEITITVNGGSATKIHTSCSQPIDIGFVFGDFMVLDGASKDGGPFCP